MRRTASQMYPILEEFEKSGQSKKEFCREKGLNLATFWYWYGKYQKRNQQNKFIEVGDLQGGDVGVELQVGKMRVKFNSLPPVEYLRKILVG